MIPFLDVTSLSLFNLPFEPTFYKNSFVDGNPASMSPHFQEYTEIFFMLCFSARFNTDKQIPLSSVLSPLGIHVNRFCWFSFWPLIFNIYPSLHYCSFSGLSPRPSIVLHRWGNAFYRFNYWLSANLPYSSFPRPDLPSELQTHSNGYSPLYLNIHWFLNSPFPNLNSASL